MSLPALAEDLAALNTTGFLVVQGDRTLCERYAPGWSAERPHFTASLAKSLVGGVSLLVALTDGRVHPGDLAAQYVPQWAGDPLRSQITVRHLATHSSGLDDAHQEGVPHEALPGWMGQFWRREPDPFSLSRDVVPVVFPPGSQYLYSNPGMAMLSYCVTAALQRDPPAAQRDVRSLLKERVYDPIGLRESEWSIGYQTPYHVDGLMLWANWGGGAFTARATARIARLIMQRGAWQGGQLLDPQWVDRALAPAGTPLPSRAEGRNPASGVCWYANRDGVWPDVPRDAFAGGGAQHQLLLVVPSLELIVVRQGGAIADPAHPSFWGAAYHRVFAPVMASLRV